MHTVMTKRDIYKKSPWIALNLYKAFCEAKDLVLEGSLKTKFVSWDKSNEGA